MRRFRFLFIASAFVSLAIGFGAGIVYDRSQNSQTSDAIIRDVVGRDAGTGRAVDFSLFWQVWDRLHERYVDQDKLDAQRMVYGAISGMVNAGGDPYTTFFEPARAKKFQEEVSGSFGGVGMEVGKRNGVITVIAPIKDSPAIRAGIIAGDTVLKINDTATDGMSVEEAVDLIRGKRGTTVTLAILHVGHSQPQEIAIVRDTIKIPAVDWKMLDGRIAYLQIYSFNANVDGEFTAAAKAILASNAERLVIDLRNNPGGLLDSAVNLAGWLLPPRSLAVQERYGNGLAEQIRTSGNGQLTKYPTVVLINGGSASASEILAGALHDGRNVPLVGEKSFGKGSVQQVEEFYNGSSMKVTIAKWMTPSGINISESGITPTAEVKIDPKDFADDKIQFGEPTKDPQLAKALEIVGELR